MAYILMNEQHFVTLEITNIKVDEFIVINSDDEEVKLTVKKVSASFGSILLLHGVNQINLVVNSF